jgi:hypothetical protein
MAYYGSTTITQGAGSLGQFTGKLQAYADGVVGGPSGGPMPGALMTYRDGSLGQTDYGVAVAGATDAQIAQMCEWLIVNGWMRRCDRNLLLRIGRDIDAYSRGSHAGAADLKRLYEKGLLTIRGYNQFTQLAKSQMAAVGAFFSAGLRGLGIVRPRRALSVLFPALSGLGQTPDPITAVVEEEPALAPSEPVTADVMPDSMGPPQAAMAPPPTVFVDGQPLPPPPPASEPGPWAAIGKVLSMVGAAGGAYHGYKRNDSVGWAIGWSIFGGAIPVLAIPIAVAQGVGKPKRAKA